MKTVRVSKNTGSASSRNKVAIFQTKSANLFENDNCCELKENGEKLFEAGGNQWEEIDDKFMRRAESFERFVEIIIGLLREK